MNAPRDLFLPDVQSLLDARALAIHQVGIRDLRAPIAIRDEDGQVLNSVGRWTMTVGLPATVKGTHMSRFVDLLERPRDPLDHDSFAVMLLVMLDLLDAPSGRIEVRFPYFMRKKAPVSGVESMLDYDVTWRIEKRAGERPCQQMVVNVPVTSLCPCSKEIAQYGAHNQRSVITIGAGLRAPMSFASLIRLAEAEASCELYGLLKRPDEKYVTERAYDNPKFVEDLVRDVALRLMQEKRLARWQVICENFESIHNHSAYAELSSDNV